MTAVIRPSGWVGVRVLIVIAVLLLSPGPLAAALSGKWHFALGPGGQIVDVAQAGSAVTFTLSGNPFSGTFASGRITASTPASPGFPCGAFFQAIVSPDEQIAASTFDVPIPPCTSFSSSPFVAMRCECFDG